MRFTHISLIGGDEDYDILFINGKLFWQGDYYHSKMFLKIGALKEFNDCFDMYDWKTLYFSPKGTSLNYYDYDFLPKLDESLKEYLDKINKNFEEVKV